jgi:hypothetical protein
MTQVSVSKGRIGVMVRLAKALWNAGGNASSRSELSDRLFEFEDVAHYERSIRSPRPAATPACALPPFPVLVTSNKGLFVLWDDLWRCLLPVVCFGVARHEGRLFLGASAGIQTYIVSADITGSPADCALANVRTLLRYETRYRNERVHQIAFDPKTNHLICANSRRNSLLVVDADGGAVIDEKFLFADATGFPIFTDQNHINSVTVHGDTLLFAAHTVGSYNGSALGFVADDQVHAYRFESRGIHDVMIHDNGIMFTDSFRDSQVAGNPDISGAIRFRGREYRTADTDAAPGKIMLRGLAARDRSIMVGYSGHAPREARFGSGGGGVIALGPEGSTIQVPGPFSQVYDVLPFDGSRTDQAGSPRSAEQLDEAFRREVGPLLYQASVVRGFSLTKLH